MEYIYIVIADCGDSSITVGIFTDPDNASNCLKKYEKFFDDSFELLFTLVSDGVWEDNVISYKEIYNFDCIKINKMPLNKEIFTDMFKGVRSEDMKTLITQWNRDYKIGSILL